MPKVLIVDDKEDNLYVLNSFFKLFGFNSGLTIIEAKNSFEAFEKAKLEKPDLIFMDIKMETDYAGLEIVRKIRDDSEISDIVIWALTSQAMGDDEDDENDKNKCIKAGCNDYITKPFSSIELLKKVAQNLKVDIPEKTKLRMGIQ